MRRARGHSDDEQRCQAKHDAREGRDPQRKVGAQDVPVERAAHDIDPYRRSCQHGGAGEDARGVHHDVPHVRPQRETEQPHEYERGARPYGAAHGPGCDGCGDRNGANVDGLEAVSRPQTEDKEVADEHEE